MWDLTPSLNASGKNIQFALAVIALFGSNRNVPTRFFTGLVAATIGLTFKDIQIETL